MSYFYKTKNNTEIRDCQEKEKNREINTRGSGFPPASGGRENMLFSYHDILIYYQYRHKIMKFFFS
jgi:hypothetical protein